jgi:hypothetical protein
MQAYDAARFDPPAPLALVAVKSEQLGIEIHDVPMLLDTGADVSLLPRSYLAQQHDQSRVVSTRYAAQPRRFATL